MPVPMFEGNSIYHVPHGCPECVGDSRRGVATAHAVGATALDVNARTCWLNSKKTKRVVVFAHWSLLFEHGFVVKPGQPAIYRRHVEDLTVDQLHSVWAREGHYRVLTDVQMLATCAEHSERPFIEMKPSIWTPQVLDDLHGKIQDAGLEATTATMTIQQYGRTARGRAAWERAAHERMRLASNARIPTMLLHRSDVDWDTWAPVLSAIKGHQGHGDVVSLGASPKTATRYGCSVSGHNARAATAKIHRLMAKEGTAA